MEITFLGLGIMGSRMAARLLSEYNVTVWNRSMDKAKQLVDGGAIAAPSLQESAVIADIIVSMLNTPDVVKEIATGENGFLSKAKKGALWINTSTVNPSFVKEMAEVAQSHGVRYLDAPVSGSKIPAEKGELIFIVGGAPADFSEAEPVLKKMGKAVHHLGETGKGSAMKLVLNLILAQAMAAFSEAVALGISSGLKEEDIFNIVIGGPLAAPFLGLKKEKLVKGNYDPEFPLELVHKDLHLVLQTAYEQGLPLPLASAAKEIYGAAKQSGRGKEDIAAVYAHVLGK